MDRKINKYLIDVLSSIEEIESYFENRTKEYNNFCSDVLLRRGIERNIEIIGEAVNQILKIKPDIKIASARKIVDTRNFVIHAYDSLRPDIIWSIVINHIPKLKEDVLLLLKA